MSKPALGKGLGELMGGRRAPGTRQPPVVAAKVTPVDFGRGMTTLVTPRAASEKAEQSTSKQLLPSWFFFAADVLLLAFAVAVCLDSVEPMSRGEVVFAAVSTGLGAVLALIGVSQNAAK